MKTRTLKQLLLYNYRYLFAYLIIFGFVAYFLGWQLGNIGPGLSTPEINTAARHVSISETLNLPIYPLQSLLQSISIAVLDISPVSLRLPSIIIAALVAYILYNLLKKWFGKQTALLSTAVFLSADWFLFTARLGTGSIEFSLWVVLAMLCFTKLIERKYNWLLLFTVSIGALFFIPLGPYAALTLVASLFSCRIFRQRMMESSLLIRVTSVLIALLASVGVIYFSLQNIDFLKNILNITELPSIFGYFKNAVVNTAGVVAVLPNANPVISPTGVFFVRFFELIFILFGIIMLWRTRVNRLNLTVLVLSVVLVLASGLSDGSRGGSVVLIPAAIFMTAGIRHLMHRWKRTFPKNPYARVAAFVPLGILFVCVVTLHYFSYFWLWPNQTSTNQAFNRDFELVRSEVVKSEYQGTSCFIETDDVSTQKLLKASKPSCELLFPNNITSQNDATVLILKSNSSILQGRANSVTPLVSQTKEDNVRWLVVTD